VEPLFSELSERAEGQILLIEVNGTLNEIVTDCDLIITDDALEDLNGVAYLGLLVGEHRFTLKDLVRPLLSFPVPKNGASHVKIEESFTFHFNEDILPGSDLRAVVKRLGGRMGEELLAAMNSGNGSGSFDQNVTVNLDDLVADTVDAVVRIKQGDFGRRTVSLNLSEVLDYDRFYSISLAPFSAQDMVGNYFLGLPQGTYIIRTAAFTETRFDGENLLRELFRYIYTAAGILAGFLLLGILISGCLYLRARRRRAKVLVEAKQPPPDEPRSPQPWTHTPHEVKYPTRSTLLFNSPAETSWALGTKQEGCDPEDLMKAESRAPSKNPVDLTIHHRISGSSASNDPPPKDLSEARASSKESTRMSTRLSLSRSPSKVVIEASRTPSKESRSRTASKQFAVTESGELGRSVSLRKGSKTSTGTLDRSMDSKKYFPAPIENVPEPPKLDVVQTPVVPLDDKVVTAGRAVIPLGQKDGSNSRAV
jgi:hypothetical protein